MAVYSDKIVLKTSTDSEANIVSQIESGATDAISSGEIVIGLSPGFAKMYTADSLGNIVTLGGHTLSTSLSGLEDVDVTTNPPNNLQSLAWDASSGYWIPSTPIVGATAMDELSDVNLQANGVGNEKLLEYNSFSGQWEAVDSIGPLSMHRDVDLSVAPTSGQTLIWNNATNLWQPGVPNIVGLAKLEDDPNPTLGNGLDVNDFPIVNLSQTTGLGDITFILQNPNSELQFQYDPNTGLNSFDLAWYDLSENVDAPFFKLRPQMPDHDDPDNPEPYSWTFTFPSNSGTSGYGLATNGSGTTYWKDYRLQAEATPQLGADLEVGTHEITSTSFVTISSRDGYTLFKNNYHHTAPTPTDDPNAGAEIRLEAANTKYSGLVANANLTTSYVLELPPDDGSGKVGYALVADGNGGSYWSQGVAADLSATSINALIDVDTTSTTPVDNDALIWDSSTSTWVPGGVPAQLSGNTLGQIGDVDESNQSDDDVLVWNAALNKWISESIGIQDADDYELEHTVALTFNFSNGAADNPGEWEPAGNTAIIVNNLDSANASFQSYILSFTDSYPPTFAVSGLNEVGTWTTSALVSVVNNGTSWTLSSDTSLPSLTGTLYLTLEDAPVALPLENGKVLAWNVLQNKFVPIVNNSGTLNYNELNNKPDIPSSIDDLSDVDTATAAPVNGQVLEWDSANNKWVPGDGQSITAVTSVNELSGRVFLGLEDLIDFGLSGQPGRAFSYNTNINESGADYNNEGVWGSVSAGADLLISTTASGGEDLTDIIQALPSTGNLWVYSSVSSQWNGPAAYTTIETDYQGSGGVRFAGVGSLFTSAQGTDIQIAVTDPTTTAQPKSDSDIVIWNASNFRYEPTTISEVNGGTFGSG